MLDTLKIIRERLENFDTLSSQQRLQTVQEIKKIADIEQVRPDEPQSVCPVTKEPIRQACELRSCKFWVDHGWTRNCALNFLLNQDKQKELSIEQISLLYRKSPQRVESIYKRGFKIVQRHYLKELLRSRQAPQFNYVPSFCVTCQSKLMEEELEDQQLCLGDGFGYCSTECKKQHPPQYYEVEKFFETEFLRVVDTACEVFNFFAVEDLLGFQPNVLRNRLEKIREESAKGKG